MARCDCNISNSRPPSDHQRSGVEAMFPSELLERSVPCRRYPFGAGSPPPHERHADPAADATPTRTAGPSWPTKEGSSPSVVSNHMTRGPARGGLRDRYVPQTAASPTAQMPSSASWAAPGRHPQPAPQQAHINTVRASDLPRTGLQRSPPATRTCGVAAVQRSSPAPYYWRGSRHASPTAAARQSPVRQPAGESGCSSPAAAHHMPPVPPRAGTPGTPDSATGAISIPSSPAAGTAPAESPESEERGVGGHTRVLRHLRLDIDQQRNYGARYPRVSTELPSDGSGITEVRPVHNAMINFVTLPPCCCHSKLPACCEATSCVPCPYIESAHASCIGPGCCTAGGHVARGVACIRSCRRAAPDGAAAGAAGAGPVRRRRRQADADGRPAALRRQRPLRLARLQRHAAAGGRQQGDPLRGDAPGGARPLIASHQPCWCLLVNIREQKCTPDHAAHEHDGQQVLTSIQTPT